MMRPPMRKASDASFSALICPVSMTVSPAPLFSAVIVRTGRAWTALASVFRSQPASRASADISVRPSVAMTTALRKALTI